MKVETFTLELPSEIATRLNYLRKTFGEELITEILEGVIIRIEGEFALKGTMTKQGEH